MPLFVHCLVVINIEKIQLIDVFVQGMEMVFPVPLLTINIRVIVRRRRLLTFLGGRFYYPSPGPNQKHDSRATNSNELHTTQKW